MALGFIADLLLGRFLGLSSFIFLVYFWLVKPSQREERIGFFRAWIEFLFTLFVILFISFFIIGRVLDVPVGWLSLSYQLLAAASLFPPIYLLRSVIRRWLIDPNDVNYQ